MRLSTQVFGVGYVNLVAVAALLCGSLPAIAITRRVAGRGPRFQRRSASMIAWAKGCGASCGTLWPIPSKTRCWCLPVNLAR